MLILQVRRTLNRHRTTNILVSRLNLILSKSKFDQHIKAPVINLVLTKAQYLGTEIFTKCVLVKHKLKFKRRFQTRFHRRQLLISESLRLQSFMIDMRSTLQGLVAQGVSNHIFNLVFRVSKLLKCRRNRLVDNLEVTTARKLLELNQRKIRLNTGRVAIHNQANRSRRSKNRDLSVSEAVLFTNRQRPIP